MSIGRCDTGGNDLSAVYQASGFGAKPKVALFLFCNVLCIHMS